ncbi:MAG: tRNA (guanine(46)-N(7))-methyltransferase TrmB [Acidimicrobiia bacterium]
MLRGDSDNQLVRTFRPRRRRLGAEMVEVYERSRSSWSLTETGEMFDPRTVLVGCDRVVLEIGAGRGDLAIEVARQQRNLGVVAIDVHTRGIANMLAGIERHELTNLRLVEGDAQVFVKRLADESLDEMWVFFPDPWPKARHRNRRLLRDDLIGRLTRPLRVGGVLRLATDIEDYALTASRALAAHGSFGPGVPGRPDWRIETVFERRGVREGRGVLDFSWTKVSQPQS